MESNTTSKIGIKLLLLIFALSTLGCVDNSEKLANFGDNVTVKHLEDVLANNPDFSSIGSEVGTVYINTTVPLVCAAVYGEDTVYGMIATDLDMMRGAHNIHSPRLTSLKPGTVYHVRFHGIDANGTFYQSKDYIFTTKTAEKEAGKNLALITNGAKITGISSNFGGSLDSKWGGNNAIDGDFSTEWSSNGDGDNAWIEIELKEINKINKIGLFTRTMGSSGQILSFQIKLDGGQEVYGPFEVVDATEIHYFDVNFTTKKLLFEVVDSSGGNTGAVEIEVYGKN